MLAQLHLTGIECRAILGVYPQERVHTRKIIIDLSARVRITKAIKSDRIQDAVDYEALSVFIRETVKETQFELIESLGAFLLRRISIVFPLKNCVLTIHKPGALTHVEDIALTFYQHDQLRLVK